MARHRLIAFAAASTPRILLSTLALAAAAATAPALAQEGRFASRPVHLLKTVPIPAGLAPLHGFDISWVDPSTQLYYLGDRSNAAIDVVDARTGTFVKAIPGGFAGVK